MLLTTTLVELRVVAGRSRTRVGRPHTVSGWPMLIHTCHVMPMNAQCRGLEKSLSERHGRAMARAWHDMCESNTAALCKSNDTRHNLHPQRHGMAWARHGMCELAFSGLKSCKLCDYADDEFPLYTR
jgi:hypothetical protein